MTSVTEELSILSSITYGKKILPRQANVVKPSKVKNDDTQIRFERMVLLSPHLGGNQGFSSS